VLGEGMQMNDGSPTGFDPAVRNVLSPNRPQPLIDLLESRNIKRGGTIFLIKDGDKVRIIEKMNSSEDVLFKIKRNSQGGYLVYFPEFDVDESVRFMAIDPLKWFCYANRAKSYECLEGMRLALIKGTTQDWFPSDPDFKRPVEKLLDLREALNRLGLRSLFKELLALDEIQYGDIHSIVDESLDHVESIGVFFQRVSDVYGAEEFYVMFNPFGQIVATPEPEEGSELFHLHVKRISLGYYEVSILNDDIPVDNSTRRQWDEVLQIKSAGDTIKEQLDISDLAMRAVHKRVLELQEKHALANEIIEYLVNYAIAGSAHDDGTPIGKFLVANYKIFDAIFGDFLRQNQELKIILGENGYRHLITAFKIFTAALVNKRIEETPVLSHLFQSLDDYVAFLAHALEADAGKLNSFDDNLTLENIVKLAHRYQYYHDLPQDAHLEIKAFFGIDYLDDSFDDPYSHLIGHKLPPEEV